MTNGFIKVTKHIGYPCDLWIRVNSIKAFHRAIDSDGRQYTFLFLNGDEDPFLIEETPQEILAMITQEEGTS